MHTPWFKRLHMAVRFRVVFLAVIRHIAFLAVCLLTCITVLTEDSSVHVQMSSFGDLTLVSGVPQGAFFAWVTSSDLDGDGYLDVGFLMIRLAAIILGSICLEPVVLCVVHQV